MDAILTIALRHVRAFLEGTRDCMRDIADMGISSCFRSWSHLFFYLGKILPGVCRRTATPIMICIP
jgi:hypothetical protein